MKKTTCAWTSILCLSGCVLAGSAHAYSAFDPDSPYMFGDWGGLRTKMAEQGITFKLDYTGEAARNVGGGYNSHSKTNYADQTAVGINFDLDKLVGISGADFQMTAVNRNGHSANNRINDPNALVSGSSVQEVQGRGPVTRLVQFWYRQRFFDDALTVKLGRIPVGDDFDTIDSNFQNLAFGGGQTGNWANGIYNWPIAQWAAVAKYNFVPEAYFQAGVFNLNDKNLDNDRGFNFATNGTNGVLYMAELGYTPTVFGLPGTYKVGYYHNNLRTTDYGYHDERTGKNNSGVYYMAQQQMTTEHGDTSRGISLFSMGLLGSGHTAGIDRYVSYGLVYKGPFDIRPKDDIGFAVGYLHFNKDVKDYAHYNNNVLLGSPGIVRRPTQSYELDAELYYGIALTNYLTIRPNIQYVVNPSGVSSTKNAWVVGTMVQAHF